MNKEWFKADQRQLDTITKALDGIAYKAPTVMKDAANKAGKVIEKMIREEVQNLYTTEGDAADFVEKVKSATYANPARIISYKQQGTNPLIKSEVSPSSPVIWSDPGSWVEAQVRKDSGGGHVRKNGNKGFVAIMHNANGSNHTGVFVRKGETIEQVMGPSFPEMVGKAYEKVESEASDILHKEIDAQIKKVMDIVHG